MKYLALVIITIILSVATPIALLPTNGRTGSAQATQNELKHIGGVIRCDLDGNWDIIDDDYHTPAGFGTMTQTDELIRIKFNPQINELLTGRADVDERYLQLGIVCGTSISAKYDIMSVMCTRDGEIIKPGDMYRKGGNIWLEVWAK